MPLFLQKVKFCGRIFRADGVIHDPSRVKALTNTPIPTKASELQQILMASQWTSKSIPNYNSIVLPLHDIFEMAMRNQPRRTKKAASRVYLEHVGWNDTHSTAFNKLKDALVHSVQLAYPNNDFIQCVFCDASLFLFLWRRDTDSTRRRGKTDHRTAT